jgi:mannose-1-phosphate guanylyltransferase
MIAETAARLRGLVAPERVLVVTAAEHAELVRRNLRRLPPENVLAEPAGRNTAACAAWAALEIERRDPGAVHVVLPSDHVIEPAAEFRRVLAAAFDEAASGDALLTLGIRPTSPATGYGYIEAGEKVGERDGVEVRRVVRFVEKPDRARAEAFLATGRFLWNAGIFVWATRAILGAFERHQPELLARIAAIGDDAAREREYPLLPSLPVDVAILEKADNVRVVPIAFSWSDVGSWTALSDVVEPDERGNVVAGGVRVLAQDAGACVVHGASGELVALIGVSDLVVVRAGKATLVCPKERAQDVKRIVERLGGEAPSFL